jgi:hypothetical protein
MTPNAAVDRFAVLAVRRNLSLGVLRSSSPKDFALMLAAAAQAIVPDRAYTEGEINDILRQWLATAGSMLAVDHVELRRWLVDTRVLDRDGYGRAYGRGSPDADIRAFIAAIAGVDLGSLAQDARERDAAARDERKRRFERSPEPGHG